jgi:mRNA-degrading endonuclease toxin of MazEF toxin-antitoxin module
MPEVSHPAADRDASPAAVTVGTTTYAVDSDGIVQCPDDTAASVADRLADAHGVAADALLTQATCQAVKDDGEVCGRELPCRYHSETDA